ncbi:ABC-2 type transport system permease protein [Streptomyces africanus]|uniref:ABC-2 type transport system permease protein n=1 Tax=Streptomyces africanus TaxID=231024 RepID=A0ABU0QNN2_9ACTN|nr:ABC transporter permease [Streptomyces africanus]MDQ0748585.1 ABC-2 type transport system permease protein [Streptomyces africanus]
MSKLADRAEPVEVADGYRAGRTLPFRVELVRQLKRRRTMVMGGVLFALPLILLIAFQVGGDPGGNNNRVNLMDTATASGANFAAVNLFSGAGFLLVIPVALFCGDTVASEASWSSLRYLLAAPVPRARLLWSKLAVGLSLSLAALVLLPIVALVVGTAAYGWGPLQLPTGGTLPTGTAAQRLLIVVVYIMVSQLVTAALAFWLSTRTDAPLGAVGGAVFLTIIGSVLDEVTALGDWRHFLPAHWQYAWLDAVQPRLQWTDMIQGTSISVTYALVLFALAFRGFARKDVVS